MNTMGLAVSASKVIGRDRTHVLSRLSVARKVADWPRRVQR